jgi:hypothetical protein
LGYDVVNIQRVRVALTGFPGAPGVSTFYALDGAAMLAPLRALYQNRRTNFPSDVRFTFETIGDIIDPLTGDLMGTWTGTNPGDVVGTDSGIYSAPSGLAVTWLTGDVLDGRRLRGRTFMVPLASDVYALDGGIGAGVLAAFVTDAAALVAAAAANFVVWHRPNPSHAGGYSVVIGSRVSNKAAILTSRRD